MRNTRSPLRPTIRLLLVCFLVGVALGLLVPRLTAAEQAEPGRVRIHVVAKGESLWSLAERYSDGDPRRFIYETQTLNGLAGPTVFPGQKLTLPAG